MSTTAEDTFDDARWISDCCAAVGYMGLSEAETDSSGGLLRTGICSKCKDHATFHQDEDYEFKAAAPKTLTPAQEAECERLKKVWGEQDGEQHL